MRNDERGGPEAPCDHALAEHASADDGFEDYPVQTAAAETNMDLINDATGSSNYRYDALGNLIQDSLEHIDNISWTVTGKVKVVDQVAGFDKHDLLFHYGADGQRVVKEVQSGTGDPQTRDYYVRDAQGNIMAIYRTDMAESFKVKERPMYGSSRVGVDNYELELCALDLANYDPLNDPPGDQRYELSDHLGNVTSVLTDELLGVDVDADLDYDYFQPHVVSAQGYEPGGFLLPGRNYNSGSYSRGFNGQLKDDEVYGATGTSYTAEFWQYDARVGRRWNMDPVNIPSLSPYHAFELNPIWKVDPKGNRADEFDSDGNKISNLGGDKIDFFHQKNGDTKIVDRASGLSNTITDGESLIRGYTQRDASVGPWTLFGEFETDSGPEKSMFASFDGEETGPFGSLRGTFSTYGGKARRQMLGSERPSGKTRLGYSEANPLSAGSDMWEQMLGRTGISWYKLGDNVLYLMHDSKSQQSLYYHLPGVGEPSRDQTWGEGNTYQTYIWTESLTKAQNHVDAANKYWQQQLQIMQQQLMVGPKY